MVDCNICGKKAVFSYNGNNYCVEHFKEWIEGEALKNLKFILKNTKKVGVAVSGGKDSMFLLNLLNKYKDTLNVNFIAILIDEGIKGYREFSKDYTINYCRKNNIELKIYSFKEEFGKTLDELVQIDRSIKACTICGVFRRYLLNKAARENDLDLILFAHNLDDEVQTFYMNLSTGNMEQIARKGFINGIVRTSLFVPRGKPLITIPEKALALYNLLFLHVPDVECPYMEESRRYDMRSFIYEMEEKYPGFMKNTLYSLLNFYIPNLREKFKEKKKVNKCKICGEPTSREICKACELKIKLRLIPKPHFYGNSSDRST